MATYTIKIEAVCTGGEHITIGFYKDGVKVKNKEITKSEAIADDDNDLTDVIIFLIKRAIKDNNANTAAKRKTAIEGMVIDL